MANSLFLMMFYTRDSLTYKKESGKYFVLIFSLYTRPRTGHMEHQSNMSIRQERKMIDEDSDLLDLGISNLH